MTEIIDPFKQKKKTDWASMVKKRIERDEGADSHANSEDPVYQKTEKTSSKEKGKRRVAKSFKIYPGKISKDFDKRVNKMQVYFDDLDFDKNYVDSGKYVMFLMAFAEKYKVYELYEEVLENGEINVDKDKLKEFASKLAKEQI